MINLPYRNRGEYFMITCLMCTALPAIAMVIFWFVLWVYTLVSNGVSALT
jgi:hypothetical protein